MDNKKYIGMDVHQATISAAVRDASGKLVMESIVETKAATILQFIQGIHGSLWVTFEEGTSAAWLYDLLQPHVAQVVVCDPRRNALLKAGNKNDRVDARKLSDLLRVGLLTPVYLVLMRSQLRHRSPKLIPTQADPRAAALLSHSSESDRLFRHTIC